VIGGSLFRSGGDVYRYGLTVGTGVAGGATIRLRTDARWALIKANPAPSPSTTSSVLPLPVLTGGGVRRATRLAGGAAELARDCWNGVACAIPPVIGGGSGNDSAPHCGPRHDNAHPHRRQNRDASGISFAQRGHRISSI
jgi:hypothetical protein